LIALPEAPTSQQIQDAKKRADTLLQKIHGGLRFSDAAIAESSGSKALQGGDLGWRKLAETPTAFADQIINMQVNDIAGPIQTPNGFHLILLAGVRNTKGNALTNKQVEELLYERKMEEGLQAWLTKIRSEAFINMHPEN
jgi:peptidyl-prolyl cis-trans isomerase SurA